MKTITIPTTSIFLGINLNANEYIYQNSDAPYQATNPSENMASGTIMPDFSRAVTVYDAAGKYQNVAFDFLKTGVNQWTVEIVSNDTGKQLAEGTLTFNSNGSLASISPSLTKPISVSWTDGSHPSNITVDFGSHGKSDPGLTQNAGEYYVTVSNQNGGPVSVDTHGKHWLESGIIDHTGHASVQAAIDKFVTAGHSATVSSAVVAAHPTAVFATSLEDLAAHHAAAHVA